VYLKGAATIKILGPAKRLFKEHKTMMVPAMFHQHAHAGRNTPAGTVVCKPGRENPSILAYVSTKAA